MSTSKRSAPPIGLADLPLYASDDELGAAILGRARAKEWSGIASALERKGLPPVDALHKGRYVPAVKRWYDLRNGLGGNARLEPLDGKEGPWENKKPTRRG
jgi:hypothetical protein